MQNRDSFSFSYCAVCYNMLERVTRDYFNSLLDTVSVYIWLCDDIEVLDFVLNYINNDVTILVNQVIILPRF